MPRLLEKHFNVVGPHWNRDYMYLELISTGLFPILGRVFLGVEVILELFRNVAFAIFNCNIPKSWIFFGRIIGQPQSISPYEDGPCEFELEPWLTFVTKICAPFKLVVTLEHLLRIAFITTLYRNMIRI